MDNKKDKTQLKSFGTDIKKKKIVKRAGHHFSFLKRAGQGVTKKMQGAAPCKNGLGRTLISVKFVLSVDSRPRDDYLDNRLPEKTGRR